MFHRKTLAGAALIAALGLGMPAIAQSTDTAPDAAAVDSAQLDAFVLAYVEVSELREQYIAELQQAQSEEDQQAIMQEANAEITGAVDAVDGMDVATYETILAMAQDDPELVNRINSRIETISNQ